MIRKLNAQGFTAVELLITLFVAAAFLIAGYQLFDVIIKDGAETRAESEASNIAYDYLRRYSDQAANPCAASTPITSQAVEGQGLTDATISISISCPQEDAPSLSKIEAVVVYNKPAQTVRYATFVDKSTGASPIVTVTDGLVAWWKLNNGSVASEVGPTNSTGHGQIAPIINRDGVQVQAYNFNPADGESGYISATLTGLPAGDTPHTISLWVNPTSLPSSSGRVDPFSMGNAATNQYSSIDLNDTRVSWYFFYNDIYTTTPAPIGTWTLITLTYSGSGGTTTNKKIYLNGAVTASQQQGASYGQLLNLPSPTTVNIGRDWGRATAYYSGRIDDVRIYNRALSASEVLQLYNGGPQ